MSHAEIARSRCFPLRGAEWGWEFPLSPLGAAATTSAELTSLALPIPRLYGTELGRAGRNRVAAMEFVSVKPHFAGAGLSFFWLV